MWTDQQDLVFWFKMALRRALSVLHGMRKSLSDEQQDRVAELMIEHLRQHNWKIDKGPPAQGGANLMR
jgi:hypothetical protein